MMALSSANTKYTAEQLIRATGISSETLATWGLTQATDTLTVSQLAELASSDAQAKTVLEKIVVQNAQAVANGKVTATNIALATSEEGATLATGAFTTAIKANIAAIKTWLLTTPAGWITMLIGGIFTAIKLYDLFTISVEEANEKIDESRSAYEKTTSTIESMNSELETTKKRIEELEAKDTLSFTDKAELDNLREQNNELERSISLLEKKRQNEAKQTVVDIKQNQETLDEDFDKSIKNLSEYKKEYEETRQLGIKGMAQGTVTLENYEATMAAMDKTMSQYESSVLDNIEKYEQYKEDIINKYGTNDISTFSQSDRALYNDIVSQLQAAYKEIYTDSEYNKFVIEPIFDEEKLKGLQDELLKYFISGGQTDLSSLEEKFGTDIITALRSACEKAGIDFDKMIEDIYNNSQSKLDQIAPLVDKPSGAYDAKQNQISKQIRDYIQNDLSEEDRTILLNATIPDDVKFKTKQDVDNFIASLREDADETDTLIPISKTISDLEDLNKELDNLGTAMANIDTDGKFDLGDLDSIADYFLGLEDVPYDIEAVNNALKSLGDGNASLEEQADSINTLADQYLKTSGILDTLTQDNAELIKLQLQRMGIVNAEEIVEATLNGTLQDQAQLENILAQYKSIVTGETLTLANVTAQEIQNLIAEGKITNDTANQMAILAIKKQLVNGNTLNTSADINNLISLCQMLGATTTALEKYNQVKNGANGMPQYVIDKYKEAAERELKNAINTSEKALKATYTQVPKAIYNGGANVQKALDDANKSASSSAKETEDTYEELFDFFERRIEVLNDALDLLKSNLENVVGADAKNTLIDAQIGINKESINNYTDALAMYTQKANEALAKIPVEFQSKIVDGSVSITDFIGSGNEDLVDAINEYKDWAGKISDCKKEIADLKQALEDLELSKFNNIVDDFTNQFDIRDNSKDLINKQIDLFEEAGQMTGKGFYEGLIKESEGQLSILQQEKEKLVTQLNSALDSGNVEVGSEAWLSMIDSLNEVDASILDCKKDIEEFNNSIQELHWEVVERIQKNFDGISDEIKNIIGLIDEVDVSDAEGIWSKEGLAQLGLYAQEYEKAIYAANMYGEEIEQLNQAYIRGEYSATEYQDKLIELKNAQWDEINASESAKDAIMDLNKARIDIMVKAIEEEIDAIL